MSKLYEPELGQIFFGNEWSELACPEFVENAMVALGDAVEQKTGGNPCDNSGAEFECATFALRAYWWGGCTCGAEEPQHTEECERTNASRLEQWQDLQCMTCGVIEEETEDGCFWSVDPVRNAAFENASPRPEWECVCGAVDGWTERDECDPTCRQRMPNFQCGDFEVRWYKHCRRGATINRPITADEMDAILAKCLLAAASPTTEKPDHE